MKRTIVQKEVAISVIYSAVIVRIRMCAMTKLVCQLSENRFSPERNEWHLIISRG